MKLYYSTSSSSSPAPPPMPITSPKSCSSTSPPILQPLPLSLNHLTTISSSAMDDLLSQRPQKHPLPPRPHLLLGHQKTPPDHHQHRPLSHRHRSTSFVNITKLKRRNSRHCLWLDDLFSCCKVKNLLTRIELRGYVNNGWRRCKCGGQVENNGWSKEQEVALQRVYSAGKPTPKLKSIVTS